MYPSKASNKTFSPSVRLLIRDRRTNELHLNNEALNIIRNVDGRIGVCVCMGETRSGKSFLLNSIFKYLTNQPYNVIIQKRSEIFCLIFIYLFELIQLFQLNHDLNKNDSTKGCSMNSEIPMLKSENKHDQLNLVLIDTEVSNKIFNL